MGLKKIVVFNFVNCVQAFGYDQNGISFFVTGLTANEAIGNLIFNYGIKFGIEVETKSRWKLKSEKKGR